jgi:hypothetical protein
VNLIAKGGILAAAAAFLAWSGRDYDELSRLKSDETRALTPVWTIPLAEIQQRQSVSFEFSWPSDPQWQRIAERWESPGFFVACFSTPSDPGVESAGLPLKPLECRDFREGIQLPTLEREPLVGYPELIPGVAWHTQFSGLQFKADPGNRLRVEALLPKGQSLPPGILAIGPYLRGGLVKDMMVGRVVGGWVAFGKAVLGCILMAAFLVMAVLRLAKGEAKDRPKDFQPAS